MSEHELRATARRWAFNLAAGALAAILLVIGAVLDADRDTLPTEAVSVVK